MTVSPEPTTRRARLAAFFTRNTTFINPVRVRATICALLAAATLTVSTSGCGFVVGAGTAGVLSGRAMAEQRAKEANAARVVHLDTGRTVIIPNLEDSGRALEAAVDPSATEPEKVIIESQRFGTSQDPQWCAEVTLVDSEDQRFPLGTYKSTPLGSADPFVKIATTCAVVPKVTTKAVSLTERTSTRPVINRPTAAEIAPDPKTGDTRVFIDNATGIHAPIGVSFSKGSHAKTITIDEYKRHGDATCVDITVSGWYFDPESKVVQGWSQDGPVLYGDSDPTGFLVTPNTGPGGGGTVEGVDQSCADEVGGTPIKITDVSVRPLDDGGMSR